MEIEASRSPAFSKVYNLITDREKICIADVAKQTCWLILIMKSWKSRTMIEMKLSKERAW